MKLPLSPSRNAPQKGRRRSTSSILAAACALLLSILTDRAHTASIGVDFGFGPFTVTPAETAGVAPYAQTNWNSVSAGPSASNLKDNTGTPTTMSVSISGNFNVWSGDASGSDEKLNNGLVFTNPNLSFTISGIPYANYQLVLYELGAGPAAQQAATVGGSTFYSTSPQPNAPGYVDNDPATPFTYLQATSTDPAAPTPFANYAIFPGLSGATQVVNITQTGTAYTVAGAFQIIQVPEPASLALLFGGAGMLSLRRRRPGPV